MGLGVPALLFCVVVPLFMVVFLSHAARINRLDEEYFREYYGFLYSDYRFTKDVGSMSAAEGRLAKLFIILNHRVNLVWGAVIHCQTMLLVVASVLGRIWHEFYQVLVVSGLLVAFLVLIVLLRPFRRNTTQWLQQMSTAVLCATCLSIMAFVKPDGMDARQIDGSNKASKAVAIWVLVINISFLIITVLLLFYCAIRQLFKKTADDASSRGALGGRGAAALAAAHASGFLTQQDQGNVAGRGQPDLVVVELADVSDVQLSNYAPPASNGECIANSSWSDEEPMLSSDHEDSCAAGQASSASGVKLTLPTMR
jgi:hypothetical protein